MAAAFGKTRIVAPDGVEWRVGRRWMTRPVRPSLKWRRDAGSDLLTSGSWPGGDSAGSLEETALILVGVLVVALVLVPVLLFGIELIALEWVLAVGLAGRVLLGRPWTVQARSVLPAGVERQLEWNVKGWRQSGRVIDEVAQQLASGREPTPPATQML